LLILTRNSPKRFLLVKIPTISSTLTLSNVELSIRIPLVILSIIPLNFSIDPITYRTSTKEAIYK